MSKENWEELESEECREEVGHLVRDIIKIVGVGTLAAATGGVGLGMIGALAAGTKSIHDSNKRSREREGD